jgi:DNA-binding transcriptional regulator YiaG
VLQDAITDLTPVVRARRALKSGRAIEIRLAAGLSQSEIATALGVSQAAVCRWEAGERRPRGDAARRYGQLLDVLERAAA